MQKGRAKRVCDRGLLIQEIDKPNNFLNSGELMSLKPNQRKNYVQNKIIEILELNENGVTVSEVVNATGFEKITVWRHLENLTATRDAYKKERSGLVIYYKNGRLGHPSHRETCEIGRKIYVFDKLENNDGEFICIQEKEKDLFGKVIVNGGIMINIRDYPEVMKTLLKFSTRVIDK